MMSKYFHRLWCYFFIWNYNVNSIVKKIASWNTNRNVTKFSAHIYHIIKYLRRSYNTLLLKKQKENKIQIRDQILKKNIIVSIYFVITSRVEIIECDHETQVFLNLQKFDCSARWLNNLGNKLVLSTFIHVNTKNESDTYTADSGMLNVLDSKYIVMLLSLLIIFFCYFLILKI